MLVKIKSSLEAGENEPAFKTVTVLPWLLSGPRESAQRGPLSDIDAGESDSQKSKLDNRPLKNKSRLRGSWFPRSNVYGI